MLLPVKYFIVSHSLQVIENHSTVKSLDYRTEVIVDNLDLSCHVSCRGTWDP